MVGIMIDKSTNEVEEYRSLETELLSKEIHCVKRRGKKGLFKKWSWKRSHPVGKH
jgi:hypothetical protein